MKKLLGCLLLIGGLIFNLEAQENHALSLIPQPAFLKMGNSEFKLNKGTTLVLPKNKAHAEIISNFAAQLSGVLNLKIGTVSIAKKNTISFMSSPDLSVDLGREGYRLDITEDKVVISAAEPAGWFYGWQTLLQLVKMDIQAHQMPVLQTLNIVDRPKFAWRGLMVDVSRHFFSKEVLIRYIDQMAKYKLNVLHLHLTDNQGWRIEIKQLPQLTNIGAWRVPRTGYWRDMPAPEEGEVSTYGGYYSQDDIRQIIAFANSRFVEVIPEVDLPGHSLAFVAAYPEVSCTKTPQKVLAGDPWNPGRTNVLCVGNDSVYVKIDQIISEIATIFPSKYIHIGGDEVTRNYWTNCKVCQERMQKEGLKNVSELQRYFINRVANMVKAKGKTPISWYENLEGEIDKDMVQMSWKDNKGAIKSSLEGKKVVLTPAFFTYLDFYQGDPYLENAPFTVNRFSTTYRFEALPQGIVEENVLGGQGSLWTEQVPNERKLQFMTWPRGLALAENLWAAAPKAVWPAFVKKVERQLPLLEQDNVNYSPYFYDPIVTAVKGGDEEVLIQIQTEVPDLQVYYAFDDTDPDRFYPEYLAKPIVVPKGAKNIRLVTYRGKTQKSRIIRLPIAELKKRAKL